MNAPYTVQYDDLPWLFEQTMRGGVTGGEGKTWTYHPEVDWSYVDPDDVDLTAGPAIYAGSCLIAVFLVAAALVAVLLLRKVIRD